MLSEMNIKKQYCQFTSAVQVRINLWFFIKTMISNERIDKRSTAFFMRKRPFSSLIHIILRRALFHSLDTCLWCTQDTRTHVRVILYMDCIIMLHQRDVGWKILMKTKEWDRERVRNWVCVWGKCWTISNCVSLIL